MKDQPKPDAKILEALEACRPHGDDLSDPIMAPAAAALADNPELATFHRRLEQLDARIATTFHDVPVPEGLADRIGERLANAQSTQAMGSDRHDKSADVAESDDVIEPMATVADRESRISRRWLLLGAGGIVAAVSMLVAVSINVPPDYDEAFVLDTAKQLFEDDWDATANGQRIAETPPPDDYPMSRRVVQGDWVRWRPVPEFLDRHGVAYDLTRLGSPRATLYVTKCQVDGLLSGPSSKPFTTGDRSVSAWQEGPLLFVLVVEGGQHTYRNFLSRSNRPIT